MDKRRRETTRPKKRKNNARPHTPLPTSIVLSSVDHPSIQKNFKKN